MSYHILIPTDGSEQAEKAVEYGLSLAEAFEAKIHALYVVETKASYIYTVGLSDQEREEHREYGREVVTDVVERGEKRGLDGTGVVKTGRVPEEIVDYADENDIGGIVMGKQGHGAINRYIGGTAEKVMRMTSVPVTVIGPGSE